MLYLIICIDADLLDVALGVLSHKIISKAFLNNLRLNLTFIILH